MTSLRTPQNQKSEQESDGGLDRNQYYNQDRATIKTKTGQGLKNKESIKR
jgi:hypothetical protein